MARLRVPRLKNIQFLKQYSLAETLAHAQEEALLHQLADTPLVSVIIPTFNSEKNIKQCLQSIRNQEYQRVEAIVVDSHSTDQTVEESRKLGARVLLLNGERSEAKNYAAEKAKGEFVFFVDSDMRLKPNVISECLKAYYENKVHGIVVPEKCIGYSLFGKSREAEKNFLSASLTDILQKSYSYGRTIPNLAAKRPQETFRKYAGIRVLLLRGIGSHVNGLKSPSAYLLDRK